MSGTHFRAIHTMGQVGRRLLFVAFIICTPCIMLQQFALLIPVANTMRRVWDRRVEGSGVQAAYK